MANLLSVSLILVVDLHLGIFQGIKTKFRYDPMVDLHLGIFPGIKKKFRYDPNTIVRGLEEGDHEKT